MSSLSQEEAQENCAICHLPYGFKDVVKVIHDPAGQAEHYFHKECIERWLKEGKKQCPLCRQPIKQFAELGSSDFRYRIDDDKQVNPTKVQPPIIPRPPLLPLIKQEITPELQAKIRRYMTDNNWKLTFSPKKTFSRGQQAATLREAQKMLRRHQQAQEARRIKQQAQYARLKIKPEVIAYMRQYAYTLRNGMFNGEFTPDQAARIYELRYNPSQVDFVRLS
jgi:hypothetical protein